MSLQFEDQVSYISIKSTSPGPPSSVSRLVHYFNSLNSIKDRIKKTSTYNSEYHLNSSQEDILKKFEQSTISTPNSILKTTNTCGTNSPENNFIVMPRRTGHIELKLDTDSLSPSSSILKSSEGNQSHGILSMIFNPFAKKKEKKPQASDFNHQDLETLVDSNFLTKGTIRRTSSFKLFKLNKYSKSNRQRRIPNEGKKDDRQGDKISDRMQKQHQTLSPSKTFKETLDIDGLVPHSNTVFLSLLKLTDSRVHESLSNKVDNEPQNDVRPVIEEEKQHDVKIEKSLDPENRIPAFNKSHENFKPSAPRQSLGSLFDLYNQTSGESIKLENKVFSPNTHRPTLKDVPSIEKLGEASWKDCFEDCTDVGDMWKEFTREGFSFENTPKIDNENVRAEKEAVSNTTEIQEPPSAARIEPSKSRSYINLTKYLSERKRKVKEKKTSSNEVAPSHFPSITKASSDNSISNKMHSLRSTFKRKSSFAPRKRRSLHVHFKSPLSHLEYSPVETTSFKKVSREDMNELEDWNSECFAPSPSKSYINVIGEGQYDTDSGNSNELEICDTRMTC